MHKTFRLFISSTFNDFKLERQVLQTQVFPKIKEYASSFGYSFQPIDLRWGVSDEAQYDQKTLELCLNEVRACKTHIHPNFLVMLGDRYGWIPLPYAIEKNEFKTLLALTSEEDQFTLQEWYQLDDNQLPSSYILKERTKEYMEFKNWEKIENKLLHILQKAVNESTLSTEEIIKYFQSATEAEVQEGILQFKGITKFQKEVLSQTNDTKHIFGFLRNIDKSTQKEEKFITEDYEKAQNFKKELKKELKSKNILEVQTVQKDKEKLDELYLATFKEKILNFLKEQIDIQRKKELAQELTPLEIELQAQSFFAINKRKNFIGQEILKKTIADYIQSNTTDTLVIYGNSGRGKSALIAKSIQEAENTLQSKIIYRFIGATPNSSSSKEILTSILEELSINLDTQDKEESFEDFSHKIYDAFFKIEEPITIFIDAVDQLEHDDQFLWLPKKLPKNLKIIISALKDQNYKEDSKYLRELQKKTSLLYEIPLFNEPLKLLETLLQKEERTVKQFQKEYFLSQYNKVKSPLYIYIAAQEIKNWKSDGFIHQAQDSNPLNKDILKDKLKLYAQTLYKKTSLLHEVYPQSLEQHISATQKSIIEEYINNLTLFYHHNPTFIQKALGFLYASKDGLSENEILQLLAQDEKFIKEMAPETWHENPNKELPLIHWSRLHTILKPFLSLKKQDSEELIYFFHREFLDVIRAQENQKVQNLSIIKATQSLITKNSASSFHSNRWGKLYATLIVEYKLLYNKNIDDIDTFASNIYASNEDWVDAYLSYLSITGDRHCTNNRLIKAVTYQEHYLSIAKSLYENHPSLAEAYIIGLNNLAISYKILHRSVKAIKLEEESLTLLRTYYKESSKRWRGLYVTALSNLAQSYRIQKNKHKALELAQESLKITQESYQIDPKKFAQEYANSLYSLSLQYTSLNQFKETKKYAEKALIVTKKYYQKSSQIWVQLYASILDAVATQKNEDEQAEKLTLREKVLEIRKSMYKKTPSIWVEDYIISLYNTSYEYANANRLDEAISLQQESLDILQKLYEETPSQWIEHYSRGLSNLATHYIQKKDFTLAKKIEDKSLHLLSCEYKKDAKNWMQPYIDRLLSLATSYDIQNMFQESINLIKKASTILSTSGDIENTDEHMRQYVSILRRLIDTYVKDGNTQEFFTTYEESMKLLGSHYKKNQDYIREFYLKNIKNYIVHINYLGLLFRMSGDSNNSDRVKVELLKLNEILVQNNPKKYLNDYMKVLKEQVENLIEKSKGKLALEFLQTHYDKIRSKYGENHLLTLEISTLRKQTKDIVREKEGDVTYSDLLQLAKFITLMRHSQEVNLEFFVRALKFLNLNSNFDRDIHSILTGADIDDYPNLDGGYEQIQAMKKLPQFDYDENMQTLANLLKDNFSDCYIGTCK